MKSRLIPGLLGLFVATAALQAQVNTPPTDQDGLLPIQSELDQWRALHGPNWRVVFDNSVAHARFIYGGHAAPLFTPRSDADFFALARHAAAATAGLHGIEVSTLVDDSVVFLPLGNAGTTDKMTVQFRQAVRGVPVVSGYLNVLFDLSGNILSVDTTGMPGIAQLDVSPAVGAQRVATEVAERFTQETGLPVTSLGTPELVIYTTSLFSETRQGLLAWQCDAHFDDHSGEMAGYTYYIDAKRGTLIERLNAVHNFDVSGNLQTLATPGLFPDSPTNLPTPQPMVRATVTSPQGNATTDANGDFNIVGAVPPLNVTVRYVGQFANVVNNAGASYSLVSPLALPSGNPVLMNTPATTNVTAEANSFVWINKLRDWIRAINPADITADFLATSNVNQSSTCNAFYNGSSVNFYLAGGGCANTSYSGVIAHEMGHWYNVRYGSGNGGDGFGEGNADVFAMYIGNDPVVGHNFCGNGCNVRTGLNTRQFCGDANPGCYGGVHNDGEVLMGALWKVRARLMTTHGASAGAAICDTLFNSWMNAYNDGQIKTIIETHWLTLDDDNGNINDGTPNYTDIDGGFKQQGFPGFTLVAVNFANVTQLSNTPNVLGPYTVNADVTVSIAPPLTAISLRYRINGGAFQTVPMTLVSGSTYTGNIPGQVCKSKIDYYLSGTNSSGITNTFPATAPTGVLSFIIGQVTSVIDDNFQNNMGWTEAVLGATSGQWQRGTPVNDPGWAYDPAADYDGSGQCFLTQNQVGNTDVDNGSVELTSGTLDLSASGDATISYAYFLNLTNSNGVDRLLFAASSNGAAGPFVTLATHTASGGLNWTAASISQAQLTAAGVAQTNNMMFRFTANDGGTQSIVEAGVDAFKIVKVDCSTCPLPTLYCSAKFNSLGCLPSIGAFGVPSATLGSGFVVVCDGVLNNKSGLLFYGITGGSALPFQGGTLCVAVPIRRTPGVNSGGSPTGNDCTGQFSIDMNAFAVGALGGSPLPALTVPGTVVSTQWWGRDPGFAPPNNTTLSGGLSYTVCQ